MKSPRQFSLTLERWQAATEAKMDALARQVCFEMAQRVVEKTPVDTGFLRGSWQPSIGAPETSKEGEADPSGAAAQTKIVATIPEIKAGDHFYMMNNARYARHVEFGTSKMAGRYYVTDTVKSFQAVVADVAAQLGLKKK